MPPAAYGSGGEGGWSLGPDSLSEGGPSVVEDYGTTLEDPQADPDHWLGPDMYDIREGMRV